MIVLGLNHGEINSSAALVVDGKVVAGAPEERFNRQKRTKSFPSKSVDYCLKFANKKLNECDYIAQAWNPGAAWIKYNPMLSSFRVKREDYFYTVPDNLFQYAVRCPGDWVKMEFADEMPPVYYVQHHRAHAAKAFYLSPFEEAAILTCDQKGEFETATMSLGRNGKLKHIQSMMMPHSLGMFYSAYTELLGYRSESDEWKVMALSAFDVDCEEYYRKIRSTINLLDNGFMEYDLTCYKGYDLFQPKLYTQKLVDMLGGREGVPGETADEWHMKIAKAMQRVAEEIAIHMLKKLHELTKCENLAVAGGFFMNSVLNGKILDVTPFKNIYIPYAPTDAGNSIGAALYVTHQIHNEPRWIGHNHSSIGPEFSNEEIETVLKRRKIRYEKIQEPERRIAELLSRGEIVAVMQGRMEFGERALGNRSILADPRGSEIKDKINSIIKYRESYRPFAPAVKLEDVGEFFEVAAGFECKYMEKVVPIKEKYRPLIPAVTHVDGSGRVQTVTKEDNPFFYKVITEFGNVTGLPVVLNTSFNINGEPIVLSPDDAVRTFYNSGLEFLFLNEYFVSKVN